MKIMKKILHLEFFQRFVTKAAETRNASILNQPSFELLPGISVEKNDKTLYVRFGLSMLLYSNALGIKQEY